jgi:hypothetical protein
VTLSDEHVVNPDFTPPGAGTYRFRLVLFDGCQHSRPDEAVITATEGNADSDGDGNPDSTECVRDDANIYTGAPNTTLSSS